MKTSAIAESNCFQRTTIDSKGSKDCYSLTRDMLYAESFQKCTLGMFKTHEKSGMEVPLEYADKAILCDPTTLKVKGYID